MTRKKLTKPAKQKNIKTQISIIIPVFNKAEYTRRCLETIFQAGSSVRFEVIVVDNASADQTPELLRSYAGQVRTIANQTNQGFVRACNQGAAKARGKYLLFLNNDTTVPAGWLESLLEVIEQDNKIGAVGAKLVYPDGKLQEAGGLIFSDGSGWNFGKGDDPEKTIYNQECEVDYCSGACLLVRSKLFKQLGGFDSRYAPAYYEDVDLCFGLRQLGYKVVYTPKVEITHYEGVTAGTQLNTGFKRYQAINHDKFIAKWKKELRLQDDSPAVSGHTPVTSDRARLQTLREAARQEDKFKKSNNVNILVVDPTLPLYDKQAGSLRLFNILKIFREEGCNVTYIAREGCPEDKYAKALEAMGIEVYAYDPEKLAQLGQHVPLPPIDLKGILHRKFFHYAWLSFFHIAEQYLPDIRQHSPHTKIVIDTVDVHFVRENRQAKLLGSQKMLKAAQETQKRELGIYRQADEIITVTEEDRQVLAQQGIPRSRISILPIIFSSIRNPPHYEKRQDLLFVANFNHLPNIDAVEYFHASVLPLVLKKLPEIKCHIVGNNPPAKVKRLAGPHMLVTGYVPDIQPYLRNCRVSIAPLRFGAGMKGKIVEAMSHGLPVVTTAIGSEGMNLADGVTAMIAPAARDFADKLVRLYTDAALWERLSVNGRKHVEQHFSPDSIRKKLAPWLGVAQKRGREELAFYREHARFVPGATRPAGISHAAGDPTAKSKEFLMALITQSRGYKALQRYYRVRDSLCPMGSSRRKIMKFIFKTYIEYLAKVWHGLKAEKR